MTLPEGWAKISNICYQHPQLGTIRWEQSRSCDPTPWVGHAKREAGWYWYDGETATYIFPHATLAKAIGATTKCAGIGWGEGRRPVPMESGV